MAVRSERRHPDIEPGSCLPGGQYEHKGKPTMLGVNVGQHLSIVIAGKAYMEDAMVRTGLGKADFPGSQGGLGKRGRWWNCEPIPQPKGW